MSLYAIGDLHLCLGAYKPMDVFGGRWEGYMDKLREGLSVIQPGDTTVLLGDLSWALGIEQAEKDFAFIHEIPGRKIILKGNHDYWWTTAAKFYKFCAAHGWDDMFILNNNCYYYGDTALCGTRGRSRRGRTTKRSSGASSADWRPALRRQESMKRCAFSTIRRATAATSARKFSSCLRVMA